MSKRFLLEQRGLKYIGKAELIFSGPFLTLLTLIPFPSKIRCEKEWEIE